MDAAEPFIGAVANLVLLVTEHRLPSRGVVDLLRIQVPIPDPIVCAPDRERVTLFAFSQFLLCPFALNELGRGETARKRRDRKSTRLNSSHQIISYAVFCLKKKKKKNHT